MEACRRALSCGLLVLHMLIQPRNFGLEQSFYSFFRHQCISRVFCDYKQKHNELADHIVCLLMIDRLRFKARWC